ncbi:DUF4344 domain-containing metallopeptidase [Nonomuraea longicatena]|uniref:Metallopeptidase n=1 Tax=Nonomuraea longicatena TaxID=83682 RepID=A0ABP3ZUA6_9ACTN
MKIRTLAVAALLSAAALTACGAEPAATTQATQQAAPQQTQQADPQGQEPAGKQGAFVAVVAEAKEAANQEMRKAFAEDKALEEVAQGFNELLKLPEGEYILAAEECGQANAFWSPDEKKITICYELLTDAATKAQENFTTDKEKEDYITGVLMDTLFHELGHAVISIYDLPTVGKEDDAVDQPR